jgi:ATP-dependent helicase/nuclease subunit B
MGQFYTIAATNPFAETLVGFIDRLCADQNVPPSKVKIYVPTRRAIRTLKDAFLKQSNGKPRILPIIEAIGDGDDGEMSILSPHTPDILPAIDPLHRQMVLARLLEKAWGGDYNFSAAIPIAADLGRLIDQMHTENIDFTAFDTAVNVKEFARHWEITLSFLRLILKDLWPNYLRESGLIDGGLYRRLRIKALEDFYQQNPPQYPVIIAGTTGSHPATRSLIRSLNAMDHGYIILPGLDQIMDDTTWIEVDDGHPQHLLKRLIDYCKVSRHAIKGIANHTPDQNREFIMSEIMRPASISDQWQRLVDPLEQVKIQSGLDNIAICECDHEDHEARTIAIAMADIAADPNKEKTCVLITPDRLLSNRVQSHLQRWGLQCDDSGGQALSHSAIGRFACGIVDAEKNGQIYPISFLSALKNPLAGGGNFPHFRTALRSLEKSSLRGVRPQGDIRNLKNHTSKYHDFIDHLGDLFAPLSALSQDTCSIDKIVKAHIETMENIAATTDMDGAERLWVGHEGEAMAALFEKILSYRSLIPPLSLSDYAEFLQRIMDGIQVRAPYGMHPRLSILGQIESRMVSADRVIMGGLNEGTWPPETGFDAWMSRPMRADIGLPSLSQKTTLAAHDFTSALGSKEVIITYAKKKNGQPTLPSRWIQRLNTVLTAANIAPEYWPHKKGQKWTEWAEIIDIAKDVRPCTRPMPSPCTTRRPKKFSFTDIEKWMRDPYALYAKRILRLRAMDDVDEDPTVADRGTLIHSAMERFTREYPADLGDTQSALKSLIMIGREVFEDHDNPEIYGLWWPRFERAAKWVIDHESEWRTGTKTIYAEAECTLEIKIQEDTYTLIGKADRIEKRQDGSWAIIDYKTGGVPSVKDVIAGVSNQLPLEAHALLSGGFSHFETQENNAFILHYWSLNGAGIGGYAQIAQGKKYDSDTLIKEAGEGLKCLIKTFSDKKTAYIASPDPSVMINPDHNDYTHLERIAEWSVIDGGEN